MNLVPFGIENMYSAPKQGVENPQPTAYQAGDIVKVLVGPATDRLGRVIVERNGNYIDFEPNVLRDGIGVAVVERMDLCLDLDKIISKLSDPESLVHTVVRWFDEPIQLELVRQSRIN